MGAGEVTESFVGNMETKMSLEKLMSELKKREDSNSVDKLAG